MVFNLIISLLLLGLTFSKLEYNLTNSIDKNIDIIQNSFDYINISEESYELFSNVPQNINDLKSDKEYLFFMKVKQFNFIRFTLTLKNQNIKPFSYISYQELSKKEEYNDNNFENIESESTILNTTHSIISISKNISEYHINYIFFKIIPSYDIDYMLANVDIADCLFDLLTNDFQEKYNLITNINYYIKTESYYYPNTFLRLRIYNSSKFPFSYLKIYECSSDNISNSSCEIKIIYEEDIDYKINKKKKEFYFTIEIKKSYYNYDNYNNYKIPLSSIQYLFFEFMPVYNIQNMTAKIENIEEVVSKSSYYYILIIIIFTIIIVTITLILYYRKYRNTLLNLKDTPGSSLESNNQGYYNA